MGKMQQNAGLGPRLLHSLNRYGFVMTLAEPTNPATPMAWQKHRGLRWHRSDDTEQEKPSAIYAATGFALLAI